VGVRIQTHASATAELATLAQTAPAAQLQQKDTIDAGQPYKVMKAAAVNSCSLTIADISMHTLLELNHKTSACSCLNATEHNQLQSDTERSLFCLQCSLALAQPHSMAESTWVARMCSCALPQARQRARAPSASAERS
jgi:hypothetical protein